MVFQLSYNTIITFHFKKQPLKIDLQIHQERKRVLSFHFFQVSVHHISVFAPWLLPLCMSITICLWKALNCPDSERTIRLQPLLNLQLSSTDAEKSPARLFFFLFSTVSYWAQFIRWARETRQPVGFPAAPLAVGTNGSLQSKRFLSRWRNISGPVRKKTKAAERGDLSSPSVSKVQSPSFLTDFPADECKSSNQVHS